MKKQIYDVIHSGEEGWWYRGRSAAVKALMGKVSVKDSGKVLDFGAGYGAMYPILSPLGKVDAVEIYPEAQKSCLSRGYGQVFTTIKEVLASGQTYDAIGAFDTIEHVENDQELLGQFSKCLRHGGVLLVTVPAHQFLFGPHDEASKHFRRYSKSDLQKKLEEVGFEIQRMSYWNATFFPIAAIMRYLKKLPGDSISPSPIVNTILLFVMQCEAVILRYAPLPMGLSIVLVATKKSVTAP